MNSKSLATILCFSLILCSCFRSQEQDSHQDTFIPAETRKSWNFKDWSDQICAQAGLESDKTKVIEEALFIYEMRVRTFVIENKAFSVKHFKKEDKLTDLRNSIKMGAISMKSLEQILNFEINRYNSDNLESPIGKISLRYMENEDILPAGSIAYLISEAERLEDMDIKKKERKEFLKDIIADEILRNCCKELEKQRLYLQF